MREDQSQDKIGAGIMPGGQHVMLSYHENNQDLVYKVGLGLKDENIPIWFEERKDMMHDLRQSLSEGVENAAIICCFISSDYEQCDKCKRELQHAHKQYKVIIPCLLNDPKIWKPSDWLESITNELECIVFEDIPDLDIDSKIIELIYQIKYQPRLPQSLGSSLSKKPSYLFEWIRHEYQQNSRIERLINPEKSYPIEQSYINLAIVTTKEQQAKEKQLHNTQYGDAIMSTFEEIYGMKTTVDIKNIFETCKNQKKQVLVLGRAGIGKSTFCRYAAYQWAMGAYWSEYELVALIPLRRLTADRYPPLPSKQNYSLVDIVKKEIFCSHLSEKDETLLDKQFNATKTLWILDGYDEMVQDTPAHLEHLFEMLLKTPHHILTSRPYNIALSYDVPMEITGFTDENIEQFVQQFFDQLKDELDDSSTKGQNLLNFLRSNPTIWGVAHIPVNLELICSFWSNEELSETTEVKITTIYTKMTEWLCRRYLKASNSRFQQLSRDDIDQLCQAELTFLETLAFNAMRDNIIILRPVSLRTALSEAKLTLQKHPHILNIGFLKSFTKQGVGDQIQLNKDHYFVHLSFQEYFAARYLTNAFKDILSPEVIEFINSNKYNQRFTLLFTFTAGILGETNFESGLNIFWDIILRKPIDLAGIRHIQLILSCLGEIPKNSTFSRRAELRDDIIQWMESFVFSKHYAIQKHIITSLARSPSLLREQNFINSLIKLLEHHDSKIKITTCHIISSLPTSNEHSELLPPLYKLLHDKNKDVRRRACIALGKIGEKAGTNEVISKLVTAFGDENEDVRQSACEALGKIDEKAGTSEVISKLVIALEDENEYVRRRAWIALGKIGEKAGTSEVTSKLVTAFRDGTWFVRESACFALGNIGEKAGTSEVISKLVMALEDENEDVRQSACIALGKIGEKAGTSEVISKLVTAFRDGTWFVRESACFALGNIGEKAGTSEVISKLVMALEDENEDVRQSACIALGKIGEKAGTSEVISKLVTAFGDENEDVRQSACEALGNIGEKAGTSEVISKLATALEHENKYLIQSACFALGNIGEKAGTSEVISKLVMALEDENEDVRQSACIALGKIGEKAGTSEVISKLVMAFTDGTWFVRESACEALGNIGEKAGTSEVISKLATALEHENEYVREYACKALGEIGEKAGTSELISKLVTALEHENEYVREYACKALGEIGEKAGTSEVISKLATALEHENEYVREYACKALGEIGEKAGTSELISKLVTAFGDGTWFVRESACEALRNIGEKATTSEVISKLVTALEDEKEDVRQYACKALGEIGEKAGTSEVISKLATALEHENKYLRQSACFALGNIGEKAGTSEVISKLAAALEDENKYVRRSACTALGNIGEKAGTSEVISKLAAALEDENKYVRRSACTALGNIGEKAGTSEVIKRLLERFANEDKWERLEAREILRTMLRSSSVMIELRSDAVALLYNFIETDDGRSEWTISSDNCIKMFLNTNDDTWLHVATLATILEGNAVIVTQSSVIVYGRREPIELRLDKKNLRDQFVEAFAVQTKKLRVPSNL